MGLSDMRKALFLDIFEADQIEQIMKIDMGLGYDKDSANKDWIYEALNLTYPEERLSIYKAFENDPNDAQLI